MRRFTLIALSCLLGIAPAMAQDPARIDTARMSAIVKARAADDRFMGSVLVAKNGTVLFEESVGWANLEWKIANTPATKFRIFSITKQFTAASILLLAERGKLSIDDPLGKYLPSAPQAWKPVTVRQLLSHTGGIPEFPADPDAAKKTPAQRLAFAAGTPLQFTPGEGYAYSNAGYTLLGWIIEATSGQSYEAFLRDNIFQPLGMNDSGLDSEAAVIPQRAAGYVRGPRGPIDAPFLDMRLPFAAGAIYSTPRDLLRWTQGLFGGKVLSAASLEQMTTPVKNNYAFGLQVGTTRSRRIISHNGSAEGFKTQLNYYPESQITIVVLANIDGPDAFELAPQLEALAFGETVTLMAERKEIELPAATLQKYVGFYQLNDGHAVSIRLVEGRLAMQVAGQGSSPMFAESEKAFFLKDVDVQMEFVTEADGRATELMLQQGANRLRGRRFTDPTVAHQTVTLARPMLETYVGTYEVRPGSGLTVTLEGDQLMGKPGKGSKLPLLAEAEGKFFFKTMDMRVEFVKDDSGAITHALLVQGGRSIKAVRKP